MKDKRKEWLEKEGPGPPWPNFFTEQDIAKAKGETPPKEKRTAPETRETPPKPDKKTPPETREGLSPFKKKKDQ